MRRLMSGNTDWIEHFQVSEENLTKWREQAGPNEDLLRWCLLNGKLMESDYLQWACEHYELPAVEAQYFSLPPDTDFWDRIRTTGPWSPSLVPLHEWQGVLLIACVSPDPNAKFAQPHRFVLSSARALSMLWMTLNQNFDRLSRSGLGNTSTATIPIAATKTVPLQPQAAMASEATPERRPDLNLADKATKASDAPSGLATDLAALASATGAADDGPDGIVMKNLFEPAAPTVERPTASDDEITAGPEVDAPEGLAGFARLMNAEATGATTSSASIELDSISFEISEPAADETTPVPTTPLTTNHAASSSHTPSPASQATEVVKPPPIVPYPKLDTAFTREQTGFTASKKLEAHEPPPPGARASLDMSQISKGNPPNKTPSKRGNDSAAFAHCSSLEDVAEVAFSKMSEMFQKSLILVFQSGQLRPWKWSDSVAYSGKGKPNAIELDPPSMFKIVYSTALPYHGYVVSNPTNNAFFTDFNGGVNPGHVTIMPILVNSQIAGMLMGMTDAPLNLKATLHFMELVTEDVGTALTRLRSRKAA